MENQVILDLKVDNVNTIRSTMKTCFLNLWKLKYRSKKMPPFKVVEAYLKEMMAMNDKVTETLIINGIVEGKVGDSGSTFEYVDYAKANKKIEELINTL